MWIAVQHTALDNFENIGPREERREGTTVDLQGVHLVTSCEERFDLREGVRVAALMERGKVGNLLCALGKTIRGGNNREGLGAL